MTLVRYKNEYAVETPEKGNFIVGWGTSLATLSSRTFATLGEARSFYSKIDTEKTLHLDGSILEAHFYAETLKIKTFDICNPN